MSRMNDPQGSNQGQQAGGAAAASLKDTAQEVSQNLRNLGSQVKDQASQQFDTMRQQANDYYEQGRQRAMEMEQSLEDYVQEKPIQALLIAAGVGMLLGMIWKRS